MRMSRSRQILLVVLVGIVALVAALVPALAGVARAHANVESASPAPDSVVPQAPTRVVLTFSEPLAAAFSTIAVLDAAGAHVDGGDSAVDPADDTRMSVSLPALPDGMYTVSWRNVSTVDGHSLRGSYVFYVGARPAGAFAAEASSSASPALASPLEPYVRWLVLAGLLVACGALLFELAVLEPALRDSAAEDVRAALAAQRPALARLWLAALALCVAASLAHLLVQAAGLSDVGLLGALGRPLRLTLTATRWGQLWTARVALAVLAAALLIVASRRPRWRLPLGGAALVALGAALATLSLSSHGSGEPAAALPAVANDFVHVAAAATWSGGLAAMLLIAWRARALADAETRGRLLAALTPRFSPVAVLAVGAIVISGLYAAWVEVARLSALATPYGVAVLLKVGLLGALLLLGAVNQRWVSPRLRHNEYASRVLVRTLLVEVALVLAALLAAGFLTSLQPAKQAQATVIGTSGAHDEQTVEGTRIRITVEPAQIGTSRVTVDLADGGGRPITNASYVGLRLQYADADLGAHIIEARSVGAGRYVADGVALSLRGTWQVEADVSRPDAFDARAAFRFPVRAPGTTVAGAVPSQQAALLASGWEVLALAVLLLGVSEAWWSRARAGRPANWTGAALAVAGIMMVYGVGHTHLGQPPPTAGVVNPQPADERSIALGRDLYAARCVSCHGSGGLGAGPLAKGLNPPPADLVTHVPLHSDGELFGFIAGGFPASAMPAFTGALSDEEIWNLVNYLRTLR